MISSLSCLFSPQHNIFINFLGILHSALRSLSLPSLPWSTLPSTLAAPSTKQNNQFVLPRDTMEHDQTPSGQPLKENRFHSWASRPIPYPRFSPLHHPPPEAINSSELHLRLFITILKDSSIASCLNCFFLGVRERLSQRPSMSLLLRYRSAVINTTAKEASFPIASGSTDDG